MNNPFTRVVAGSVYQRNMNELAKSKTKANNYLDNEVNLFNQGRANLNKISAWHNKISSFHDKSTTKREDIDKIISRLVFDVSLLNDDFLNSPYCNQPLDLKNITTLVMQWREVEHTNLSLANRQLFHALFVFFRDVIKNDCLNDIYNIAFNVLDVYESGPIYESAKNIISNENSLLRGVSCFGSPANIEEGEFGNYLYDEPYSLSLNAYNTANSLAYLFESDPMSICLFYNSIIKEHCQDTKFSFSPDSLLEIYHPVLRYNVPASALHTHDTDSIEPSEGIPIRFLDSAILSHKLGTEAIINMRNISANKSHIKSNDSSEKPQSFKP